MARDTTARLRPEWAFRVADEMERSHQNVSTRAERARQLLAQEYWRPWTLAALARAVGCNRTTLQEEFRRLTRTSVHRFLVQHRVSVAQRLLAGSDLKVSRIAQEVGYRSCSAFARQFKTVTGTTLMTYRRFLAERPDPPTDAP